MVDKNGLACKLQSNRVERTEVRPKVVLTDCSGKRLRRISHLAEDVEDDLQ